MNRLTPHFSLLLLVVCLAFAPLARADLDSALQAQHMLGRDTWSRVLKIHNQERRGLYPAVVYATVFEFNGILWFYTDADGTQSLSLYKNRLEQDKADLAPLLLAISPGFRSFVELPDRAEAPRERYAKLRNGCFVESVHALRRLQAKGKGVTDAKLLLFYVATEGRGVVGHTGLVFTTAEGDFYWDPERPGRFESLEDPVTDEAIGVVREVLSRREVARVQRALFVPVRGIARPEAQFAAAPQEKEPARDRRA